jgi:hypothetical protein
MRVAVGPARAGAQQMVTAAQGAQSQVAQLVRDIQAAGGDRPWGTDTFGQACDQAFSTATNQVIGVNDHVQAILGVGNAVLTAVQDTEGVDQDAAAAVTRAAATGTGIATGLTRER